MTRPSLMRSTIRRFLSGGGPALLGLLIAAVVARAFDSPGFGAWATVFAWIVPLGLLVEAGLPAVVAAKVAADRREANSCLRGTVPFTLAAGVTGAALLAFAAPLLSRDVVVITALRLAAPLIVTGPLHSLFVSALRAKGKGRSAAVLDGTVLAAQLVVSLMIVNSGGTFFLLVITAVAAGALRLFGAAFLHLFTSREPAGGGALRVAPLLGKGVIMALAVIAAGSEARIGVLLLGWLDGAAEAGLYAASVRLIDIARLLPGAFFAALLPALSFFASRGAGANRIVSIAAGGVTAYALIVAGSVALGAGPILTAVFGRSFAAGAGTLTILALSLVPSLLRSLRTIHAFAMGVGGSIVKVNFAALAIYVVVASMLIPGRGAFGAAIAAVAAETAALVLLLFRPVTPPEKPRRRSPGEESAP